MLYVEIPTYLNIVFNIFQNLQEHLTQNIGSNVIKGQYTGTGVGIDYWCTLGFVYWLTVMFDTIAS